jgi:hypothetical protein
VLKNPSQPYPIPKIGDMIRSMEGFTFASALDLIMGYYQIILDHEADTQKTMYHCIPMVNGKIQIHTLTHGYQDCLVPEVFQNIISKLVQNMEYFDPKFYLDDLMIVVNSSFKDHIIKSEMVLARLPTK